MTRTRVLIVEDEGIVALGLQHMLDKLGYQPLGPESTGVGAVAAATQQRPDVVLMDIRLEGSMDGIAAAELIRRSFAVPIVFATAYSDDETLQRVKSAEPFGYLTKPIDERDLHATLQVSLHRFAAEQALHRLEDERQANLRTLRRQVEELEGFAHRIAKDLHEPLRRITQTAQELERDSARLGHATGEELARIRMTTRRMREAIDASLQFAHVGWNAPITSRVRCDEALDSAIDTMRQQLQESNVRVNRAPLPQVIGDPSMLQMLFVNLLRGALAKRGEAPLVLEVSARQSGPQAEIAFAYSGQPLSADDVRALTDPARAFDSPPLEDLPLAICQRVIARHGGRLWARPHSAAGSQLVFTLPVA